MPPCACVPPQLGEETHYSSSRGRQALRCRQSIVFCASTWASCYESTQSGGPPIDGDRIVVDMLVSYVQARIHFRRREALRSIMLPNCGCELNLASKQTWHSDFYCAIRNTTNSSLAEKLLFVQTHNMASCYQSQPHPPPNHGQRSNRAVSKSPYSFFPH